MSKEILKNYIILIFKGQKDWHSALPANSATTNIHYIKQTIYQHALIANLHQKCFGGRGRERARGRGRGLTEMLNDDDWVEVGGGSEEAGALCLTNK